MTTRTKNVLAALGIAVLVVAAVVAVSAVAFGGSDSPDVKCPNGFTITDPHGNKFTGTGDVPPGGGSIVDSSSGDGSSYSAVTDENGTTLNVHSPGRFRIACK